MAIEGACLGVFGDPAIEYTGPWTFLLVSEVRSRIGHQGNPTALRREQCRKVSRTLLGLGEEVLLPEGPREMRPQDSGDFSQDEEGR